jgi:hypothetical protein
MVRKPASGGQRRDRTSFGIAVRQLMAVNYQVISRCCVLKIIEECAFSFQRFQLEMNEVLAEGQWTSNGRSLFF